jgi:phosphomannomutase
VTSDPELLSAVFKAYDIRGVVPDQLDDALCASVGAAFVEVLREEGPVAGMVVGYDMRPSSPQLAAAFADGVASRGVDVTVIGLASTDELYFASGFLGVPGAMFTASHNPAQYNGIKLCRAGAAPVGQDTGLAHIRARVAATDRGAGGSASPPGQTRQQDLLAEYASYLRSLVDLSGGRALTVVVDAGNGMAGLTVPAVLSDPSLTVVPMYFELDGTFPNHEANPIEPANLVDLQREVIAREADVGLAFDGDADRCFVVDERGEVVTPSTLTALIATRELAREPGSSVVHNLITSRAVPEVVIECGGTPVRTRVGHSFIKQVMAETGAVFGGEHSGHFYFRDFWGADSGLLAALHTLAALGESVVPLSALLAPFDRYAVSGEVNSTVADPAQVTAEVRQTYQGRPGVTIDELDGLTVSGGTWWFNLRPSNTEPLLRLNVEASTAAELAELRDEVLGLVRSGPPSAQEGTSA